MPSEVREKILIELLGDKMIHINYLDIDDTKDAHEAEGKSGSVVKGTLRHAICVSNQSEQSAYDEAISGRIQVPYNASPQHFVPRCEQRHEDCKFCGNKCMYIPAEDRKKLTLDLQILGSCRQLYEEANHLLWATNTFSFDDPTSFQQFVGGLNSAQKRNLSSLHIDTKIGGRAGARSYWTRALKTPYLKMLRGVHTLHLCLEQQHSGDLHRLRQLPETDARDRIAIIQNRDLEPILRLRALALKKATVVISEENTRLSRGIKDGWRWTVLEKNKCAESIRTQLLDPQGAQFVKFDAEAKAKEALVKRVRVTKIQVNRARGTAARQQRRTDRRLKIAANADVRVDRANKKAKVATGKIADELRQKAERMRSDARSKRSEANIAVNKAKTVDARLESKIAKHERAVAKLAACDKKDEEEVGNKEQTIDPDTAMQDRDDVATERCEISEGQLSEASSPEGGDSDKSQDDEDDEDDEEEQEVSEVDGDSS